MRKSRPSLSFALAAAAFLAAPVAGHAAGSIEVDRTIDQQCQLGGQWVKHAETFSLPIRLQFTVPASLQSGEPLVIDRRRTTLTVSTAAQRAIVAEAPEAGMRLSLYIQDSPLTIAGATRSPDIASLSASWTTTDSGPLSFSGPSATEFAPALPGLDVAPGTATLDYSGFEASLSMGRYDYLYAFDLSCKTPSPVTLASIPVSPELGPPAVEALSDTQSLLAGGATLRIQGRNLAGADGVSFGGVPATAFSVVSDHVIEATVPPHAAGADQQIRVTRGGASSADVPADDFDYAGAPAPGSFDALVPLTCTDSSYPTPRTHAVGLRVSGKVPVSVKTGETFTITDLRTITLFDAATMAYGDPEKRDTWSHTSPLELDLEGATAPTAAVGGYTPSFTRRVSRGEPTAFERDSSQSSPGSQPPGPSTITAAAAAGGAVTVSLKGTYVLLFGNYAGGGAVYGSQMACVVASGASGVLARVPVPAAPVLDGPVVTKVQGVAFAGVGGVVAVTGQRINGAVTIGGRAAARLGVIGNTVYVSAPALPAGTYDVVVKTSKGTSAVSAATKIRYTKVL